jgi:hypothetical protein
LSDDILARETVDALIANAGDKAFVQAEFRRAAVTRRRNGQSMVPVYLDQLTTYADRVAPTHITPFLAALFEIHDEIDLACDNGGGPDNYVRTTWQYRWLMNRLTRRRTTIGERTASYLTALQSAPLGWLVDFERSAREDYQPRRGEAPSSEKDCLVEREALAEIAGMALAAIRTAAANGDLLKHQDLLFILARWKDLMDGDLSEVRAFTDGQLADPKAVVAMARAMTGKSWSMAIGLFGGLADRVSKASTTAQVPEESGTVDLAGFRSALERVALDTATSDDDRIAVRALLDAWEERKRPDTNEV